MVVFINIYVNHIKEACHLRIIKDMQEDKEGIFDALDTWQNCVDMATFCLR